MSELKDTLKASSLIGVGIIVLLTTLSFAAVVSAWILRVGGLIE